MILVTRAPRGMRKVTPRLSSRVGDASSPSAGADTEGFADPELELCVVAGIEPARAGVVDELADCELFRFSLAVADPLFCALETVLLAPLDAEEPVGAPWIGWGFIAAACRGRESIHVMVAAVSPTLQKRVLGPSSAPLLTALEVSWGET